MKPKRRPQSVIGWREWLTLPELGIERVKVKVDTGARTSALHAFNVRRFEVDGKPWVSFKVHPLQRDTKTTVEASAPLFDEREIRSSNGTVSVRPVIRTVMTLGDQQPWRAELTLVRRDVMGFRMLLGRQAVRGRFLVDPGGSFVMSAVKK